MFEARVVIEMVAGDVGEPTGRDPHAVETVLIEAVRRGFEREMRHSLLGETMQRAMQTDRIGRGERAVGLPPRRHDTHRSDAGGRVPECSPDLTGESRDRSFAAGAGDCRNRSWLPRIE